MPKTREEVHRFLQDVTGYGERVYFNPPESLKMTYPCIVYNVYRMRRRTADNESYLRYDEYTVTHIYPKNSDRAITEKMVDTRGFEYDRGYSADNLHHDAFTFTTF